MKIMELIGYPELLIAAICFLFLHNLHKKSHLPTNWPLIGMLPALFVNLHRFHDWMTFLVSKNKCTFVFKGPWFTNMANVVFTSDPADIRYIFNSNFSNYPKGYEFKEFFDVLGDGIFNADGDSWKIQRKISHQLINQKKFLTFLEETSYNKVENGLISVLEHVLEQNMVVDMQDLFKRFTFDTTMILVTGVDPSCLSIEFEQLPHVDAFDDLEEAIFYRHALPMKLWKLQRWVGLGREKKLSKAWEKLDGFVAECISAKQESIQRRKGEEQGIDLLTSYLGEEGEVSQLKSDQFIRDTVMNFLIAGRSTLSASITWFFWQVLNNPAVETKIVEELEGKSRSKKFKLFRVEDLKGLVYLQGAICEALRLCPPIPFEHKRPVCPDTLPSGHRVDPNMKIMPFLYGMGRMEDVWGKDCLEFKPERWITTEGGIEYVPSYKFIAFNSGPRTCIGKEIAFTQMRMVAATLLYNYHLELVEGHSMSLKNSVILYLTDGLRVRVRRRFL